MYALVSFRVASDSTFADSTVCSIVGDQLDLNGPDVPLAALAAHATAITELLGQARADGTLNLTIQVEGGPLVTFAMPDAAQPALDTVKVHGSLAQAWTRAKAEAYVAALTAYSLT